MPCALTQGYSLDCRDSAGGMKSAYVIEHSNVSGIIQSAGVVATITKTSGKRFWKFNLERSTASWEEAYTESVENGTSFHVQTLNLIFNKMTSIMSQEMKLWAQNRLMVVVEDRNGRFWLLGHENGMIRTGGKAGSGTAMGDRNGYEVTLTTDNKEPALEVSSGIISGLETPA